MIYYKKLLNFMRPYMFLYVVGLFLYNTNGFAFQFIIGFVSSNVMTGILAGDISEIIMRTVLSLAVYAGLMSVSGIGLYLGMRAFYHARMDLKQRLFRCFVRSGLEASQASHSGEGIAKINTEADLATADLYWNVVNSFLTPLIGTALSAITIFVVDWRIGLAAVVLGLIAYFSQIRFVKPLAKIGRERLDANTEAVKGISDIFQGAISIRAFNMQDKVLDTASTL